MNHTQNHFNRIAERHDQRVWVTAPAMQQYFMSMVPHLRQLNSVLDVGIGTAIFPQLLGILGRQLVGIDVSGDMLSIAQQRFPNKRLLQASGEAVPFRQNSFDLVYLRNVIKHVDSAQDLASELVRVCKSNGNILVLESYAPSDLYKRVLSQFSLLTEPNQNEMMGLAELRDIFGYEARLIAEKVFTIERCLLSDHLAALDIDADKQRLAIDMMLRSPDEFKSEISMKIDQEDIRFMSFWVMLLFSKV